MKKSFFCVHKNILIVSKIFAESKWLLFVILCRCSPQKVTRILIYSSLLMQKCFGMCVFLLHSNFGKCEFGENELISQEIFVFRFLLPKKRLIFKKLRSKMIFTCIIGFIFWSQFWILMIRTNDFCSKILGSKSTKIKKKKIFNLWNFRENREKYFFGTIGSMRSFSFLVSEKRDEIGTKWEDRVVWLFLLICSNFITKISVRMSKKLFKMVQFLKKIFKLRKFKKNFDKLKIFYILRALFSTTSWRDGRVVECTGLENRQSARAPGFESLSLRHLKTTTSPEGSFLFFEIFCNFFEIFINAV